MSVAFLCTVVFLVIIVMQFSGMIVVITVILSVVIVSDSNSVGLATIWLQVTVFVLFALSEGRLVQQFSIAHAPSRILLVVAAV